MITLYQFDPAFGLPNASAFCMKVENYLRMTGLEYSAPRRVNVTKAPKGKLPYIEDDGHIVADSSFIIEYLKAKYGDRLDANLSLQQKAVAAAFRRLMEENLYWSIVYSRWFEPDGWVVTKSAFFGGLPAPLGALVPPLARRAMRKEIWGHGLGRHNREEIYAIGCADITALGDFLADKPYFLGAEPTSLDATAYAFLANLLWAPLDTPLKTHAQRYPQLEAYCTRMKARYYPDA